MEGELRKQRSFATSPLTFGSLFAGIRGIDMALERAGMKCAWQVERDQTCQRIIRRHAPSVPLVSDVSDFAEMIDNDSTRPVRPDLVCGGFPCQDLSVAGRRAGLAGHRSGLWFTFHRIIARLLPRWVLIENVPGLLSSNGGRDMGTILWGLGQLGYGWSYRVLDAQWFGVPQRRRRVFIVGCLGDGRRAAEVLFESESLPWDSPPRREARARVAGTIAAGAHPGGFNGRDAETGTYALTNHHGHNYASAPLVAGTFQNTGQGWWNQAPVAQAIRTPKGSGSLEANLVANTIRSKEGHGAERGDGCDNLITHTLRSEGHDASEDGTGRGVPLVPFTVYSHNGEAKARHAKETATSASVDSQGGYSPGQGGTVLAFQTRIGRNGRGQPKETTDALTSCQGGTHADSKPHVAYSGGVRRLTPRECERLQGFPDDYTRWDEHGNEISDSARYRMVGNAVAVPVVEWIAKRIAERA